MASLFRSFHKSGIRLGHSLAKRSICVSIASNKRENSNITNHKNGHMNENSSRFHAILRAGGIRQASENSGIFSHSKRFSTEFYHPLWTDSHMYGGNNGQQQSVPIRSTTIICVRKDDQVVLMGDGQMTIGSTVAKPNARKLRKLNNNKVICGFAGAAADGISLVDLLEKKLSERDELRRACVETTKMWRTDKILRHLNALIIVADEKSTFELTGSGELVESDTGIIAIGSGGHYAEAAARALMDSDLNAEEIAEKAMKIAGDMCVYTNHNTMKFKIIKGQGIVEDDDSSSSSSSS